MITATSGEYLAWFNRGIHLLIAVQWDFDEVFVILSSLQFIFFFFLYMLRVFRLTRLPFFAILY